MAEVSYHGPTRHESEEHSPEEQRRRRLEEERGRERKLEGEGSLYDRSDSVTGQDLMDYAESQGMSAGSVSELRESLGDDFQGFIDDAAGWRGREDAGLGGKRIYERAQELERIASGQAGPSAAELEFRKKMQQAKTGMERRSATYSGQGGAAMARMAGRRGQMLDRAGESRIREMAEAEKSSAEQQLEDLLIGAEAQGAQAMNAQANMALQEKLAQQQANSQWWSTGIGALATLGSALIMMSDERLKTNKSEKAGASAAYEFLDQLKGAQYDVPSRGQQDQYGVMAQSAERSGMGRNMVREGPGGVKMIDGEKAMSSMLLAQKSLHDRLKALEGKGNG